MSDTLCLCSVLDNNQWKSVLSRIARYLWFIETLMNIVDLACSKSATIIQRLQSNCLIAMTQATQWTFEIFMISILQQSTAFFRAYRADISHNLKTEYRFFNWSTSDGGLKSKL